MKLGVIDREFYFKNVFRERENLILRQRVSEKLLAVKTAKVCLSWRAKPGGNLQSARRSAD